MNGIDRSQTRTVDSWAII